MSSTSLRRSQFVLDHPLLDGYVSRKDIERANLIALKHAKPFALSDRDWEEVRSFILSKLVLA